MTPPSPYDRGHKVRVAFGNGLRADIWLEFKRRFGIDEIQEFYGATDATFSTLNRHFGLGSTGVGACGRIGPYFRRMVGTPKIVKFDVLEEKILRGKDGWCIECKPGEAGESELLTVELAGFSMADAVLSDSCWEGRDG
jgi:fatty-acyl-CoA synthase